MSGPHELINPAELADPSGFSHAVVAAPGRTVYLAGQIATDGAGRVVGEGFAEQFDVALGNVVTALRASGGAPQHITGMTIYTTDIAGYREALRETGAAWRELMDRHFPAVALIGVSALVEPDAVVEIVAVAVVPAPPSSASSSPPV